MVQRPLHSRKSLFYFDEIQGRGSIEVRIAINVEYVPEDDVIYYDGWKVVRKFGTMQQEQAVELARSLNESEKVPTEVTSKGRRGGRTTIASFGS